MSELGKFTVYEGDGVRLEGLFFMEKELWLRLVATEPYLMGIMEYKLSEKDTQKLKSLISYEDFAASYQEGRQEWLDDFFEETGIRPEITHFGIYDIDKRYWEDGAFRWTFYEDDSEFNGDDFEYTFFFDPENYQKLKKIILSDGRYSSTADWIRGEIHNQETGYDFMEFCKEHDIHGLRDVHEDYPAGVNYTIEF